MSEFKAGDIVEYYDCDGNFQLGAVTKNKNNRILIINTTGALHYRDADYLTLTRVAVTDVLNEADYRRTVKSAEVCRIDQLIQILKSKQQTNDE